MPIRKLLGKPLGVGSTPLVSEGLRCVVKLTFFLRIVQVGTETLANSSDESISIRSVCCVHMENFTHVLLLSARWPI